MIHNAERRVHDSQQELALLQEKNHDLNNDVEHLRSATGVILSDLHQMESSQEHAHSEMNAGKVPLEKAKSHLFLFSKLCFFLLFGMSSHGFLAARCVSSSGNGDPS